VTQDNYKPEIEILTTLDALKKNPDDYDMVFSVEDFITRDVFNPALSLDTSHERLGVELALDGTPIVDRVTFDLITCWILVTQPRRILVHCKNGELAAGFALFMFAVNCGKGGEDRAVAELFAVKPDAACDETIVGLVDDYLKSGGELCDAWSNGVYSTGLNRFRLLLSSTRAWMENNHPNKASAA
jgi:hypothetical protein